jgi:hypothetical protein
LRKVASSTALRGALQSEVQALLSEVSDYLALLPNLVANFAFIVNRRGERCL